MRMNELATPSSANGLPVRAKDYLFWAKTVCGVSFGFGSYFVTRFINTPWYILILLFFVGTLFISAYLVKRWSEKDGYEMTNRKAMRSAFGFSGTWLLAYLAFATLAYYAGW